MRVVFEATQVELGNVQVCLVVVKVCRLRKVSVILKGRRENPSWSVIEVNVIIVNDGCCRRIITVINW